MVIAKRGKMQEDSWNAQGVPESRGAGYQTVI